MTYTAVIFPVIITSLPAFAECLPDWKDVGTPPAAVYCKPPAKAPTVCMDANGVAFECPTKADINAINKKLDWLMCAVMLGPQVPVQACGEPPK